MVDAVRVVTELLQRFYRNYAAILHPFWTQKVRSAIYFDGASSKTFTIAGGFVTYYAMPAATRTERGRGRDCDVFLGDDVLLKHGWSQPPGVVVLDLVASKGWTPDVTLQRIRTFSLNCEQFAVQCEVFSSRSWVDLKVYTTPVGKGFLRDKMVLINPVRYKYSNDEGKRAIQARANDKAGRYGLPVGPIPLP